MVAGHERIAGRQLADEAPGDAAQAVEPLPRPQTTRAHGVVPDPRRVERHVVVAVALVQPPGRIAQPPFPFEPGIQRRAGKRGQMIEGGEVETVRQREFHRWLESGLGIVIVAEQEGAVDAQAMALEVGQRRLVAAAHGVERLVHVAQVGGVQALETDQHAATTARPGQGQQFLVVTGIDRHLAHPARLEGRERAHEFLRRFRFAGKVVVDEKKQPMPGLEFAEFRQHAIGIAAAGAALEKGLDRAKRTFEPATARGFHQTDRQIALAVEHAPVVARPTLDEAGAAAPIVRLQPAMPEIVEQRGPRVFRLADHHRLGMAGGVLRTQRGVETTHHHRHAAPTIVRGDLRRPAKGIGLHAHRHQIGGFVERDRLQPVVVKANVHPGGGKTGDGRHRQRLHLPGSDIGSVVPPASDGGVNQR